jgi:hypothetical protein
VWRRPRTLAVAVFGALLLGWGTASALSGPEPVPDSYGGRFVLSYAGQHTEVMNVSGCDLGPSGAGTTAIVKPCRFEVPANAGSYLKQKILGALGSGSPPSSNTYTLTHYASNPADPRQTLSDYAATGNFTISQVTLPVLDRLDTDNDPEFLGVELTPTSGADVKQVFTRLASLPAARPFQVGTRINCAPSPSVAVKPPAVQISGFTTTTPRSLAVSVDTTSGHVAVKTDPVRIPESDNTEVSTARYWLAKPQLHTLTVSMAAYDCATATYSNQFKMSLPVDATSMDPFARTDGYFTLGLASALGSPAYPDPAPTSSWQ